MMSSYSVDLPLDVIVADNELFICFLNYIGNVPLIALITENVLQGLILFS